MGANCHCFPSRTHTHSFQYYLLFSAGYVITYLWQADRNFVLTLTHGMQAKIKFNMYTYIFIYFIWTSFENSRCPDSTFKTKSRLFVLRFVYFYRDKKTNNRMRRVRPYVLRQSRHVDHFVDIIFYWVFAGVSL